MKLDETVDHLRATVRTAAAGDGRLPTERDLAHRIGASRGTLRKALERLEREGAIWRGVGRGTFVCGREPGPSARGGFVLDTTNPSEVMEARLALEPALAAAAVLKATPAQIAAMHDGVDRMRRAASPAEFEVCDSRFHRALAESLGNRLLLGVFDAMNAARDGALWGRLKAASLTPERMARYCDEHAAIVEALRERDRSGAESAMRAHLQTVRATLLSV